MTETGPSVYLESCQASHLDRGGSGHTQGINVSLRLIVVPKPPGDREVCPHRDHIKPIFI